MSAPRAGNHPAMVHADLEWYVVLARLGVAALLGAALGLERGASGHEAGLRTHLMVSLGSALFSVASVGAFDQFIVGDRAASNVNLDVTRMAAYVAPGIGFIGAGVIVKHVSSSGSPVVQGLTTAATLWTAAAVGVAAGLGFWSGAVAAAVIALVALVLARPVSDALMSRSKHATPTSTVPQRSVEITLDGGSAASVLADLLRQLRTEGVRVSLSVGDSRDEAVTLEEGDHPTSH